MLNNIFEASDGAYLKNLKKIKTKKAIKAPGKRFHFYFFLNFISFGEFNGGEIFLRRDAMFSETRNSPLHKIFPNLP